MKKKFNMKKKLLSLTLTLCMVFSMLPTTVQAASSKPVELGPLTQYQNVLDNAFDENGLRTAKICYFTKENTLGQKVGILDKNGNWVAQPIYDQIKPIAHDMRRLTAYGSFPKPRILEKPVAFIGGYTQAVRDGKMGLLNQKGEEVIPCKYDFVQMPSEGMAAIYNKKDKKNSYLGYWSLDKNREVVAPNKYVTQYVGDVIGNPSFSMDSVRVKPSGDYNQIHDFMDGYALVTTMSEKLSKSNFNGTLYSATIIDKTGKEILPKGYKVFTGHLYTKNYDTYAQKGKYLVISTKRYQKEYTKNGQTMTASNYLASGVASTKGIIVKPTYCSAQYVEKVDYVFVHSDPSNFAIFPDSNLIYAPVASNGGRLVPGGMNFINFKGKTVIAREGSFDKKSKTIIAGNSICSPSGKCIARVGSKKDYGVGKNGQISDILSFMNNDYAFGYDYDKWVHTADSRNDYWPVTVYLVGANGKKLNLTKKLKWSRKTPKGYSDVSKGGCFWVENNQGKWGLMNTSGKEILPFVYDSVGAGSWKDKDLGFAIVTKNGKKGLVSAKGNKFLTSVQYSDFNKEDGHISMIAKKDGKQGLVNLKTGKITLPVKYDKILTYSPFFQINEDYFGMGVCVAFKGKDVVFVNKEGKEVYTRKHSASKTHLNLNKEAINGFYEVDEGSLDNRGRVIIPNIKRKDATIDYAASMVVYTKNGKVYRESANGIKKNYAPKLYPSSTDQRAAKKYQQADEKAYQQAFEMLLPDGKVEQIKLFDEPFAKTIEAPKKLEYYVGDAFSSNGFKAQYLNVYGNATDISDKFTFDVNGVKIYNGYKFTMAGKKTVNCIYNGKMINKFVVQVYEKQVEKKLPLIEGNYYIMLMGKYMTPINEQWMELRAEKPKTPFRVKYVKKDIKTGHHIYQVFYKKHKVNTHGWGNGSQLVTGGWLGQGNEWRIAKYSNFWTMRDESDQAMVVNAAGESSADGTKVIIWKCKGKAPNHAKIQFISAK